MLDVDTFSDRSPISVAAVRGVLAGCSEELRLFVPPKWSRRFMRPAGDPGGHAATLDFLLSGMASAGHGVAALSFYLGLDEGEVRARAASLGLPEPAEKPLRRPASAKPWSVWDVRLLIALWLDNVSAASIAATLGRSPSSVHGKRRWLGLCVRDRKRLTNARSANAAQPHCRGNQPSTLARSSRGSSVRGRADCWLFPRWIRLRSSRATSIGCLGGTRKRTSGSPSSGLRA